MSQTILATQNINDESAAFNFLIWELSESDKGALGVAQRHVASMNRYLPDQAPEYLTAMQLSVGLVTALYIEPENTDRLEDPVFARTIYRNYTDQDRRTIASFYAMVDANGEIKLYVEEPDQVVCECIEDLSVASLNGKTGTEDQITWVKL